MIENLLEQFKQNAKIHFDIDYANKASVKKGNKAVEKLFKLAQKFNDNGQVNQFAELLNDNNNKVDLWTAHILLERLNAENVLAERALKVIENYAGLSDVESYGEKLWLEQWLKSKKNSPNQ